MFMSYLIDTLLVGVWLGVFVFLWGERMWGSALMFFNVLFAGLLAMNFYEPITSVIVENVMDLWGATDLLVLSILFIIFLVIFRVTTDAIAPRQIRFPLVVDLLGRLVFGLGTGALVVAILMTLFETAPVNKRVFGTVSAHTRAPFGIGLDHLWLGYIEYAASPVGGGPFARYGRQRDPLARFKAQSWLDTHEQARPFGVVEE